jgi:hypothetical protein
MVHRWGQETSPMPAALDNPIFQDADKARNELAHGLSLVQVGDVRVKAL